MVVLENWMLVLVSVLNYMISYTNTMSLGFGVNDELDYLVSN